MNWLVIYTKPRWEKKVALTLSEKGIENYCPLNKVMRQWSDRRKVVLDPLFKGYVFVRPDAAQDLEVRRTDGVLNYVHWNGKPARVKDSEIEVIRKFLDEFNDVNVTEITAKENDPVLVKQGLLMNHKGILLERRGNRALVKIESMGLQLTAVFETKNLIKLN